MSESAIQKLLHRRVIDTNQKLCSWNTYVWKWESDFVQMSKSHLITEIEIKISKEDFKRDKLKSKFAYISHNKHRSPSYFYYCAPKGMIDVNEMKTFAGLIEVDGDELNIVRRAKRLHSEAATNKQIERIYRSLMFKFLRE